MVIMCENVSFWKQNWLQFNKKLAGISVDWRASRVEGDKMTRMKVKVLSLI